MTTYVALLRGIGPGNPNMTGEKFKAFFESLGFKNVETVIASGNIVFDSPVHDSWKIETKIEKALPLQLGFSRIAIVRSKDELQRLVKKNPFKGIRDEKPNYLVVTFFKDRKKELCTVIDMTAGDTPSFMVDIERKYGKGVTTRTWKTVGRILKKMDESASLSTRSTASPTARKTMPMHRQRAR
jgi:uncharacterized protein (DUF1697 family)